MKLIVACASALLVTNCAANAQPVAPTPPEFVGQWAFEVPTPPRVVHGGITITASDGSYRGLLTTDGGPHVLTVRSMTVTGSDMNIFVESPNGPVVFKGKLGADRRSFQGTVTYHNGQTFPMSGRKV